MEEQANFTTLTTQDAEFVAWTLQYPLLADRVYNALNVVCSSQEATSCDVLLDVRNAWLALHMIAREGGFAETAAYYYRQYEIVCLHLARYFV